MTDRENVPFGKNDKTLNIRLNRLVKNLLNDKRLSQDMGAFQQAF
jgi:hypothetical protein